MGRKHLPDEFTLLCERCGYDIESLPRDAACPECGKPIRESLPEARVGTRWQRRPSAISLLTTWSATLTRPGQTFADATPQRTSMLGACAWLPASALVALTFLLSPLYENYRDGDGLGAAIASLILALLAWSFALPALIALTWIEERGIRFWGPRRGWRITPAIAKVICAHASVGWLLGSALALPAHLLGLAMLDWTNHNNAGIFRGPMQLAPLTLPALSFIAGMLTFEVLVYIGMNRMKFANRARPAPAPPPLDASVPSSPVIEPIDGDTPQAAVPASTP